MNTKNEIELSRVKVRIGVWVLFMIGSLGVLLMVSTKSGAGFVFRVME